MEILTRPLMSAAGGRGAVASALQAAPSLFASIDSRLPRVSGVHCHNGLGFLPPDFAAIDIGEVDDRRNQYKSCPRYQLIVVYSGHIGEANNKFCGKGQRFCQKSRNFFAGTSD